MYLIFDLVVQKCIKRINRCRLNKQIFNILSMYNIYVVYTYVHYNKTEEFVPLLLQLYIVL